MVSHWSPSNSKSPQISRTLLSILTYLNSAVVWMVYARPSISNSSILWWLFQVHQLQLVSPSCSIDFYSPLARSKYCFFFRFLLFSFCGQPGWENPLFGISFFVLFTFPRFGLLAGIRWSVCISKSQRIFCISFSGTDS